MTLFGVDSGLIAFVLEIIAFIGCFVIGVAGYRGRLNRVSTSIGLVTHVIGRMIIAGGEPPASVVGFIVTPLYCLIAAYIGRGIWWLYAGRHLKPYTCHSCGHKIPYEHATSRCPKCGEFARCATCRYSLRENVSGRCPECGHEFGKEL